MFRSKFLPAVPAMTIAVGAAGLAHAEAVDMRPASVRRATDTPLGETSLPQAIAAAVQGDDEEERKDED